MKTAVCAILTIFFLTAIAVAQPAMPSVEKVEPPSWWANHTINPVRLLVRGRNLRGASVRTASNGIKVGNVRVNSRGDYLFVDVTINKNVKPGKHPLEVVTSTGVARVPFEINQPLDQKTHFQSVTNDDVIYLIMPDRFANGDESNDQPAGSSIKANDRANPRAWHGGDFRGVQNNLAYLKELGVTAIWLTPWYDNPNQEFDCDKPWCPNTNYHGYHAIDYYGVEDHFGTMQDLRNLVEAAHKQGIKVVQDQVANHVGVTHAWTKNPPLDNWFSRFEQNSFNNSVLLSPNASDAERNNLLHGWFNESLPDLNQNEPEVARYEIQNALWWIGMTGIDGIRQDTIQYMPRRFIRDWSAAIKKQYPRFWMVGEVFEVDSAQTAFFQGGKTGWDNVDTELPSVFDFNLWRASCDAFTTRNSMRALRDVLKYDGLYANANNVVTISGNHDTDRFMSLPGATLARAKLHLAFLLATRGIPQIYYGEELAMRGGHDPDNRRDFPGGWSSDARNAFVKTGRTPEEQEMFDHVQTWLKIRRASAALKLGKTVDLKYNDGIYVFARQTNDETVILGFNRLESEKIEFDAEKIGFANKNVVCAPNGSGAAANVGNQSVNADGKIVLTFPLKTAIAYRCTERKN